MNKTVGLEHSLVGEDNGRLAIFVHQGGVLGLGVYEVNQDKFTFFQCSPPSLIREDYIIGDFGLAGRLASLCLMAVQMGQ